MLRRKYPVLYIRKSSSPVPFRCFLINEELDLFEIKKIDHPNIVALIGHKVSDTRFIWSSNMLNEVEIQLDPNGSELSLTNDHFGITPLFYHERNGIAEACSALQGLTDLKTSDTHFQSCIKQLEENAFLRTGETLFDGVRKLGPGEKIKFSAEAKIETTALSDPFSTTSFTKADIHWLRHLIRLLGDAIERFVNSGAGYSALSGGCDSRLVLALTPEKLRKQITYYTKVNPLVDPKLDLDLRAARTLAQNLQLKHEILEHPQAYWTFLDPESHPALVISGMYGGELLGGALFDFYPSNLRPKIDEREVNKIYETAHASIHSSLTLFHNGQVKGWATPYSQMKATLTPFLDRKVLQHMALIDPRDYCEYSVYHQIWQLPEFQKYARIPFLSDLNNFHDYPIAVDGVNPKKPLLDVQLKVDSKELAKRVVGDFQDFFSAPPKEALDL